ncbi:MAG: lactate racemase domain-containing protein [Candidatus Bathyarchaeia archaeon]
MVDVWLPYDKTEVHIRVPSENLVGVVEARGKPGVKDITDEVENAIKGLFSEKIKVRGKIALALNIPDAHLAKLIVFSIMKEMAHVGLKNEDLTVVFADNPLTPRAANITEQLRGEIVSLGINTVIHDPLHNNTYICDAEDGAKVYLDKVFIESEARIVASTIEPDPYTIYSCCETCVSFGLTSLETIRGILTPILSAENIQERVFRKAIDVSRVAKVNYSISIVRNLSGEVIGCFAGESEKVLHESLEAADPLYKVAFGEETSIVVISSGGSPHDINIFSACRCLENALKVVRRNGAIILVAECPEGYGETGFHQIIRKSGGDLDLLERILRDNFSVSGFIAYRFLRAFKKADIFMVTAIPDYYVSEIPNLEQRTNL